jgi:hypothetical protein
VRKTGELKFFATDIQILEPAEPSIDEIFLNAPELPLNDKPERVAPPETKSVLSTETKNVPIFELIRRRREGKK